MKRPAIIHCTQVAVNLSLMVVARNENVTRLCFFNLIPLTSLIFWLWSTWQMIRYFEIEMGRLISEVIDLLAAVRMAARVYLIWFRIIGNSVWYGVSS